MSASANCRCHVFFGLRSADSFWELLSASERAKAGRFRFLADRRRYVLGRAGARRVLGEELGVRPKALRFGEGRYGKPSVVVGGRRVEFNVAHSGEVVLVAVAKRAVGVDVEHVDPDRDLETLASACLTRREASLWRRMEPSRRAAGLYRLWVRKEALAKAAGRGLSAGLSSLDVRSSGRAAARCPLADHRGKRRTYHVRDLRVPSGYAAALALAGAEPRVARVAEENPGFRLPRP